MENVTSNAPIRVLYMEDDAGLARLLQKRLERERYAVTIARDGGEGLALYAARAFDILLIDHNMPAYSGLQVIQQIAAHGPLPPIVMITGAGNEQVAVEALKAGARDYLVKDVDNGYLELLPVVITQVLQQYQLEQDKQRAEEQLHLSEERYRLLFEQMLNGFALLKLVPSEADAQPDLVFVQVNPAFERLTGVFANRVVGKTIRAAMPQTDTFVLETYIQVAQTGDAAHFDNFDRELGRYFEINAFSPKRGECAILFQDITERKHMEATLQKLATEDALTGLYNRRHFYALAQAELNKMLRYGRPFSLLILDIDYFKMVNDTHGHLVGDQVLRELARMLEQTLREPDISCRYGGEEFVVLTPETDLARARHLAERLREHIAANEFDAGICITVSVGVASYNPNETLSNLIKRADMALYRAKELGRNRVELANETSV